MADAASMIELTNGRKIRVGMGVDALSSELAVYFEPGVAPFLKIKDREGGFHLINVHEIVHIEGPEGPE